MHALTHLLNIIHNPFTLTELQNTDTVHEKTDILSPFVINSEDKSCIFSLCHPQAYQYVLYVNKNLLIEISWTLLTILYNNYLNESFELPNNFY